MSNNCDGAVMGQSASEDNVPDNCTGPEHSREAKYGDGLTRLSAAAGANTVIEITMAAQRQGEARWRGYGSECAAWVDSNNGRECSCGK